MFTNSTNFKYNVPRKINVYIGFKDHISDGFLNNKPYQLLTNATNEQANNFLDHVIKNRDLILDSENIVVYRGLSKEICKKPVKSLYEKRSNCLNDINLINHPNENINRGNIITKIANDLDYYLENLLEDLFKININTLDEIFKIANFTKHNLAFNAILYKGSIDKNFYILIRHLDNLQLSAENLIDAYRNSSQHCGYTPERNRDSIIVTTSFKEIIKNATYTCIGFIGCGLLYVISNKRR